MTLLDVKLLTIGFGKAFAVVEGVNFSVESGETLALVGESGSGKTLTCRSVLRILSANAQLRGGEIRYHHAGVTCDLTTAPEKQMRSLRGDRISMIFQEPMRSLSPLHRLGDQVSEVLHLHNAISKANAKRRVLAQFERVGFNDLERAWKSYPF